MFLGGLNNGLFQVTREGGRSRGLVERSDCVNCVLRFYNCLDGVQEVLIDERWRHCLSVAVTWIETSREGVFIYSRPLNS